MNAAALATSRLRATLLIVAAVVSLVLLPAVAEQKQTVRTAGGLDLVPNWPEVVAGEYAFGHAKFRPSASRPLGYRGCQNGWFPAATPPTSFGDGTAEQKEMEFRHRGRTRKAKLWTLTDRKSRNIRFKTPLPGWSLSQPLPVLDAEGRLRVIVKCHPWWVVCIDGRSGKILWKDELTPFHAMDLPENDANEAAELMTMAWAMGDMIPSLLGHRCGGITKRGHTVTKEQDPKLYRQIDAALADMAERMKQLQPDLVDDVQSLSRWIAKGVPEKVNDQDSRRINPRFQAIDRYLEKRYSIATHVWFHGYTGLEMPAPVSDGGFVYVTFGQGQVACYTLDGHRKWVKLLANRRNRKSMYYSSPALIDGKLVFYQAPEQKSGLVALDARSGETVWRTEGGTPWAKVAYTSVRPAKLPLPGGGTLDVVFARRGGKFKAFRADDGKVLGEICKTGAYSAGPCFVGDVFVTAFSSDGRDQPDPAARIKATSRDRIEVKSLGDLAKVGQGKSAGVSSSPFAMSPAGIFDGRHNAITDPAAARRIGSLGLDYQDRNRGLTVTIAGDKAIVPLECRAVGFASRGREDNAAIMRFAVIDVSDPSKPKVISRDNILGGSEMPAAISFDRHLATHGLGKKKLLGAYKTILSHFGAVNCGVIPHGDALFVQSGTHLYCLSEEND